MEAQIQIVSHLGMLDEAACISVGVFTVGVFTCTKGEYFYSACGCARSSAG
jgi:hypothetical protein